MQNFFGYMAFVLLVLLAECLGRNFLALIEFKLCFQISAKLYISWKNATKLVKHNKIAINGFWLLIPRGALHTFRVRGRAIGKGIYFPDIGIKNGINFHNFGMRNGTYFQDFYMKYIRSDILFRKIGVRNGYVFEASMACPQPKSGQVHPPPRALR